MHSLPAAVTELPHVQRVRKGDKVHLYYRRGDVRHRLPGPEGSAAFLAAYKAIHEHLGRPLEARLDNPTIGDAITAYLASADFQQLGSNTRTAYRITLDAFREGMGGVPVAAVTEAWLEQLRGKYTGAVHQWNATRSRMKAVWQHYRRINPKAIKGNPWAEIGRLKVAKSDRNRPWPDDVLVAVLRAATPEFRALLVTKLLTTQRISDVSKLRPDQYDPAARTLRHRQQKTGEDQVLHVPDALAEIFDAMRGRHPDFLLVTPRGEPWTPNNAQQTLNRLRKELGLPLYVLHGLRATGATALKMLGFENRPIRSLTGHTSDSNLETYLRGVDGYQLAKAAQEALQARYRGVLQQALAGANMTKATGLTGRAAAKAGKRGATRKAAHRLVLTVGALRAALAGLADDVPVVVAASGSAALAVTRGDLRRVTWANAETAEITDQGADRAFVVSVAGTHS